MAGQDDDTQVASIGELLSARGSPKWRWAYCERQGCGYSRPVALAPFAIRWGLEASSNLIRRHLRCSRCGSAGAALKHPTWAGTGQGWQAWPARFT